jgi:DNA topoisomerase III
MKDEHYSGPRKGTKDDKSHPPIHPVAFIPDLDDKLTQPEKIIYELISWQFLASVSKDAVAESTDITLEVAEEEFVLKGLKVKEENWLEIAQEKWAE